MNTHQQIEFWINGKTQNIVYKATGIRIEYDQKREESINPVDWDVFLQNLYSIGKVHSGPDGKVRIDCAVNTKRLERLKTYLGALNLEYSTLLQEYRKSKKKSYGECICAKSLVIWVNDEFDTHLLDDVFPNRIANNVSKVNEWIYQIHYQNESLACQDFELSSSKLTETDWLRFVEPNLVRNTINHGFSSKRNTNQGNASKLRYFLDAGYEKGQSMERHCCPNELIGNEILPPYVLGRAYKLLNFDPEIKINLKEDIKIAVLDNKLNLNHNAFKGMSNPEISTLEFRVLNSTSDYASHGSCAQGLISGFEEDAIDKNSFKGFAVGIPILHIEMIEISEEGASQTSLISILNAISFAVFIYGARVLSCSWKFGYSEILENFIRKVVSMEFENGGVAMVFAAGNGQSTTDFPANIAEVISVGATDLCGRFIDRDYNKRTRCSDTDWYSASSKIDIAAPGDNLVCPHMQNRKDRYYHENSNTYYPYFTCYGTSAAVPIVSAGIALMLNNKGVFPSGKHIKQELLDKYTFTQNKNWKENWGKGLIDFKNLQS
ncbi:MAG: S8/S53 family peptidase [Bacteroidota bacterium]